MAFGIDEMGFLGTVARLIDKFGILRVLESVLVIVGFAYMMYNISNLDDIVKEAFVEQVEAHDEDGVEAHDRALEVRRAIKPDIDIILKDCLATLGGDRVFIMEMHNGTNNTSGLPFIYGEMTYEEVAESIQHIDEDYVSLNLSRFDFPFYLEKNQQWIGSIEELNELDGKLARRMSINDVTYFAVMTIQGVDNELGYFGITFCNGKQPKPSKEISAKLTKCTQKLSILLDAKRSGNAEDEE